jgi:hypothetical protein
LTLKEGLLLLRMEVVAVVLQAEATHKYNLMMVVLLAEQ